MTVYTSWIVTTKSETSTERQTRHFSSISGTRGVDVRVWCMVTGSGLRWRRLYMCVVLWCPNCLRTGTTVVSSVRVSVCPCVCLCDVRGLGEKSPEIYLGTRKRKCDEIYWNFTFIVLNIWFSYNCSDIFVKLIWKLINEFKEIIWKSKYIWINLSV